MVMFGRMNILLASNDYYVFPATVLIESLLINHRDTDVHIFYMYDTLKEKSKKKLQKLVERSSNGTLTLVPVNQDVFRDAPVNTYFTKETYFRFLAASCLPAEVSRVLYLDVDIMVENGAERSFVVCEERDLTINKQIHENLNLPENSKYFNAGVLLMNLDKLRRELDFEMVMEYIRKHKEKLRYLDQDVLNVLYFQDVIFDNYLLYNYMPRCYPKKKSYLFSDARIIHFAGPNKVWYYGYNHPGNSLYRKYAILSGSWFWLFRMKAKTSFRYYKSKLKKIKRAIFSKSKG